MEIIDLYEIAVWDGGERHIPKFYFILKKDAEDYKKDHPHDTFYNKKLKVYATYQDFKDENDQVIRERALAKLTPAEKFVLGLK